MAPPVKTPAPPQGPKAVVTCPTIWLVNRQPASNLPGGSGGGCAGCTTVTTNAAVSANPVRYWDGSIYLTEPDIVTPYGGLFSHIRRYNNRTASDYAGANGINWFIPQMPYMYISGSDYAVVYDPNNPFWFKKSTTYDPQYGVLDVTLTTDTNSPPHYFFTRNTAGGTEVTEFDNGGGFLSHTDAAGVSTTASFSGTLISELKRSISDGTTTTIESLLYTYNTDSYIDTVTYRRSTDGGSTWTLIKKMVYTYHDGTDSFGSAGDLKTASSQNYNTSTSAWETVAVCYYRYYTTGNFLHGLQYHIGPEGYRLAFNDGVDVTTDTDANIAPYADHHFVYDSTRRVTKETAAVCIGCPGGGTTEDDFAYTARSSGTPGLNSWGTKTVQTLPNGATITVYSDEIGMPLCEIYADGTDTWAKAWQYDSNRSVVQMAEASAIDTSKITDTQDDLVDWDNSTGASAIRASTGLVRVTDYYGSTGGGAVAGYVEFEKVQQGRTGTPVKLRFYQYTSNTAGGNTIYLPSRVRVYPLSTTTLVYDDTDYSYTFQTGSNTLASRTTDLPYIDTSENGDGNSYQVIETFDTFGNLIERERQIDALPTSTIDKYTFDVVLRAVTQSVINYKASPSGPGESVTTDYTYDDKGRLTQTLGPSHDVDIAGTSTTVRTASWNVYIEYKIPSTGGSTWAPNQDRSAAGYATGSPTYTYHLVDPVTLINRDKDGRALDRITSKRSSGSGALSASDTFSQSDWKSWSHSEYTTQHQLTSTRLYHDIPSSGSGSVGTNYGETSFDYDDLQRVIQTTAPGGTITYKVWTAPQRVKEVWVGTDATGATQSNPAGSGSNNLVKVTANQYDGGSAGGDGNLTQVTQYADGSDTRVTTYTYDFRNRRITMDGEVDVYAEYTYDNRDNLTQTDRKDTTSGGNLIARHHTGFDSQNRVYQQVTYAVDPSTGGVGNALTASTYRDGAGRVVHQIAAGAGKVFTHTAYNGAGWVTATYLGTGTDPWDISNDLIVSQVENTFDDAGNVIRQISYDRLNDTTGNGVLTTGTAPKGRMSYTDSYPDEIGRSQAVAAYGAVSSFSRSDTIPTRSDTVLVTSTEYDDAGRPSSVTDPKAIETTTSYDAAGRRTAVIQDAAGLASEVDFTYTLDNLIETQVAKNSDTGDQTTTYAYGSTLTDSDIARNDLLVSITYPDSVSGSDVVTMTYNRQGQKTTTTDQRGTVHTHAYDKLGRQTDDKITTVGSDTDNAVLRISTTYEVRGMVETVTSYDAASSGTAKNQVKYAYNTFAQLVTEYQDHSSTVNTSTSPKVQYAYDTGASSSNEIRPTTVTYPAGRVITNSYDTSGSLNDKMNRVLALKDGSTQLAVYTYLGAGTAVVVNYKDEPAVELDLWGGTSGTFNGINRFGRIVDQRWVNSTPSDVDRYDYTYDRNSNRLTKGNKTHSAFDEAYTYDNVNRLVNMDRGSGGTTAAQAWTLDATGNWNSFDTLGAATPDDNQSRTSNKVNEITAIGGSSTWATPSYDAAGNMNQILRAGDPTKTWDALYDAWNRLVSVKDGTTTIATYGYDGLRRRITSYDGTDSRHYYFNNRWQDLEERLNSSSSADVTYVWGVRYIDDLVCRDDTTRRLYALQDANFNVTSVCDTSGAIQERYVYDPYGERFIFDSSWTSRSSSSYDWVIGFQGLRLDSDVDMQYVRNRWHIPLLGVWLQRDALGYLNGPDLYEYCGNNAVNITDPTGEFWFLFCCLSCIGTTLIRFFKALFGDVCAGNTNIQDFLSCLLQQTTKIDHLKCVFHALTDPDLSDKERLEALKECIQDDVIDTLLETAQFASCICCAVTLLPFMIPALPPGGIPAIASTVEDVELTRGLVTC